VSYSVQQIAHIIHASAKINYPCNINYLLTDTRQVIDADSSLFFALGTHPTRHGHHYIPIAYKTGIKNFVVQFDFDDSPYPDANFFKVHQPLLALQQLAAFHRSQFNLPVIGITGSNGKTTVKE
jgi:alanine racemase